MIKRILIRLLPRKIYEPIRRYIFINYLSKKIEDIRKMHEFCIVFIATPLHGNLGDHAIVYSQERFFADRGLEKNIVEIPSPQYQRYSTEIKKIIQANDLIVIDGGGNMGTLWLEEEHKMQYIVQEFPNNPIIIFPQTIFYSDHTCGKLELQKSADVYSTHKNLHICAREKASYDMMKKVYPTVDILLVPDIVLYINGIQHKNLRKGVIFCLRKDKEKQLSNEKIELIANDLKLRGLKIKNESTVITEVVKRRNRIKKLNKKWARFSSAQLVITDRLHGMIFAAITGTPCLAFDNSSGKVGNVYDWISNLPYIHFINDADDVYLNIDKLLSSGNIQYDKTALKPYYDELFYVIECSLHSQR